VPGYRAWFIKPQLFLKYFPVPQRLYRLEAFGAKVTAQQIFQILS
jgi:hypothetical protein